MKAAVGERVGAILSADENAVQFLGWGTRVEDRVPTEAVGIIADLLTETDTTNPCIELDSGEVVYGCECWWGPEDTIKGHFEGREVVEVSITEVRKGQKKE